MQEQESKYRVADDPIQRLRILKRAARRVIKTLPDGHPQKLPLQIAAGLCPHNDTISKMERSGTPYSLCLDCGAIRY